MQYESSSERIVQKNFWMRSALSDGRNGLLTSEWFLGSHPKERMAVIIEKTADETNRLNMDISSNVCTPKLSGNYNF